MFKQIFIDWWIDFKAYWEARKEASKLRRAIIIADKLCLSDRSRRYAVKDIDGKYKFIATHEIDKMKKVKFLKNSGKLKIPSILNESTYITPPFNELKAREDAKRKWFWQ